MKKKQERITERYRRGRYTSIFGGFVPAVDEKKLSKISKEQLFKELDIKNEKIQNILNPPPQIYRIEQGELYTTHPNAVRPSTIYTSYYFNGDDPATIKREKIPEYAIQLFGVRSTAYVGLIDMRRKLIVIDEYTSMFSEIDSDPFKILASLTKKTEKIKSELESKGKKMDFLLFMELSWEPITLMSPYEAMEKYGRIV